ncbi:hypothetical protein [Streptomyces sp. NPDC059092]|uniref:hypothetical protein n=1 Tax=Streptomyces sp. NPDC059092 TaxID=3346725 RepID=UPI0036B48429
MHRYDLRRVLTVHPSQDAAKVFTRTLSQTASLMPQRMQVPLHIGWIPDSCRIRRDRIKIIDEFTRAAVCACALKNVARPTCVSCRLRHPLNTCWQSRPGWPPRCSSARTPP